MRCPHCRENVPGRSPPERCPRCDSPLRDAEGRALRTVDLDYDALSARLAEQTAHRARQGLLLALGVSVLGFVPVLSHVAGVVLGIAQYVWVRLLVARPYAAHFSPGRRVVTRWVSRLGLFLAGLVHAAGGFPVVEMILSPALFFAVTATARAYYRFHLGREHRREPVHFLEKVLIAVLAAALVLLAVATVLIVWGFSKLFS